MVFYEKLAFFVKQMPASFLILSSRVVTVDVLGYFSQVCASLGKGGKKGFVFLVPYSLPSFLGFLRKYIISMAVM